MASSRADLRDLPWEVRRSFGHAIYLAQIGRKAANAKPLHDFGGAGVLEIIEDHSTDTYRAVYTVRFEEAVYVLHVFKKKSHRGGELPRPDRELIERRLSDAHLLHLEGEQ